MDDGRSPAERVRETLDLVPSVARLSPPKRWAIAAQLGAGDWFAAGDVIPAAGPPGGLRIMAVGGQATLEPVDAVGIPQPARLPPHGPPVMKPMVYGGSVLGDLPAEAGAVMIANRDSFVYALTAADLDAIGRRLPWALCPGAWSACLDTLRIAVILRASPDFHWLSRQNLHTIAGEMTLSSVSVGQVLTAPAAQATTLYIPAGATRVDCVRETASGPLALPTQGLGATCGVQALAARRCLATATGSGTTYNLTTTVQTAGQVAVLSAKGVAALRDQPWFARFADGLVGIDDDAEALVEALSQSELLRGLPAAELALMLQGAVPTVWRVENFPPAPIGQAAGLLVVRAGQLLKFEYRDVTPGSAGQYAHINVLDSVRELTVAGEDLLLMGADVANHLRPRLPTQVVFFDQHRTQRLFGDAPRYQANCDAILAWRAAAITTRASFLGALPPTLDVLLLDPLALGGGDRTRRELAGALALGIAGQFDERVVVVELSAAPAAPAKIRRRGDVDWLTVPMAQVDPLEKLLAALQTLPAGTDHALVVPAEGVDVTAVRDVVTRIIYLSQGPTVTWPDTRTLRTPYVFTQLLPELGAMRIPSRAFGIPYPPSTCRLRLHESSLAAADAARPGLALVTLEPASVGRWARAATERRVGVALGGGGSWGYAHIAVLHNLALAGVPVDMVTGASFGAVIGAYYCALEDGLQALLRDQLQLQTATYASFVSAVFLEGFIDRRLGHARLEELARPFLPICTDLVTASQSAILQGTVGFGVRASGSYAPLFAATTTPEQTYTDGGFTSNVPATALQTEGARLIISSDIVPPPAATPAGRQWPGPVAQFLRDVNLCDRLKATFGEMQTLFNAAGERSAAVAPVHFETMESSTLPIIFVNATRVIEQAVTEPTFWASVQNARRQWDALKGSRSTR